MTRRSLRAPLAALALALSAAAYPVSAPNACSLHDHQKAQTSPQGAKLHLAQAQATKTYTLKDLVIEAPWSRETPTGARVAGGFFKITNKGTTPDRLVGGSFPLAGRLEVHEMAVIDGVMRMRELDKGLEIKPGETVELKPGSFHVMFMELKEPLKAGQTVKGTLIFANAGTIEVEYQVNARTEAPKGHGSAPKH